MVREWGADYLSQVVEDMVVGLVHQLVLQRRLSMLHYVGILVLHVIEMLLAR
jgi:hypothetical protein